MASGVFFISNVADGSTEVKPHSREPMIPLIVPDVWQNNIGTTIACPYSTNTFRYIASFA
jgi:hypothetical protein